MSISKHIQRIRRRLKGSGLRRRLANFVVKSLTEKNGRVHAEDTISLAATIVGERCIDAAGDFKLREHNFVPGSRVFSDRINQILSGDIASAKWSDLPRDSVFGTLKSSLDPKAYQEWAFPEISGIFKGFAAGIGKKEDWGRVPLSVPTANCPILLPLQVGFNSRAFVDGLFSPIREDKMLCVGVATEALADIMNRTWRVLAPQTAVLLALETINGMAKTAPMTKAALDRVQPSPA
jgi:hypothetical protein